MKKGYHKWRREKIDDLLEESLLMKPTSVCPCFNCKHYLSKCLTDVDMFNCDKYYRWHYKNGDVDYRRKDRKKFEVIKI